MPRTVEQLRQDARQISSNGWTMFAEMISAIGVWGGIGFGLDKLFDTRQILFAFGMLVGAGMGVYIVWWRAKQMTSKTTGRQGTGGQRER